MRIQSLLDEIDSYFWVGSNKYSSVMNIYTSEPSKITISYFIFNLYNLYKKF
jgi:hypothetical protein